MGENELKKPPQQVCTIRVGFVVDTDEQAIAYKKKIGDILADMPQARIEFSINSVPARPIRPE